MNPIRYFSLLLAALLALSAPLPVAGAGKSGRPPVDFKMLRDEVQQHLDQGDLAKAETAALGLYSRYGEKGGENLLTATAQLLLAKVRHEQGNNPEAEVLMRRALAIRERMLGAEDARTNGTLQLLGKTLLPQGRYAEAEQTFLRALAIQEKISPPGSPALTKILNGVGAVLHQLGKSQEAETALNKALANSEGTLDRTHLKVRAATYYHLARVQRSLKRHAEAEASMRHSLALRERELGREHVDSVKSLGMLGLIVSDQGRLDAAEELLRSALPLYEKTLGTHHFETARVVMGLGAIEARRGHLREAEPYFRRAVKICRAANVPAQLAGSARAYGQFLVQQNRLEEALGYYREAVDAVDRLFAHTRGLEEGVREGFIGQYAPYYQELIDLLLRLDQLAPRQGHGPEALSVLSRTQSRLFSELLRQADVNRFSADPAFHLLQQRRQALLERLATLREKRGDAPEWEAPAANGAEEGEGEAAPPARQGNAIDQQLDTAENQLKALETQLWRDYPRFMELIQPPPVSVGDLQKRLLKPGEAVLTFALLPGKTAIFVVTPEKFSVAVTPYKRQVVAEAVAAVRRPAERFSATGALPLLRELDPAQLHLLYQALIEPLKDALQGAQTVFVAADGPLYALPLEMLVTRYGEPERRIFETARGGRGTMFGEYAALAYLGDAQRFAYLPSLAALSAQRLYAKPVPVFGRELVSFADPFFSGGETGKPYAETTERALSQVARSLGTPKVSLPRLPETADEARDIAALLGGRSELYLGERAQEWTAKHSDLRDVRYLHFATHGLLGGEFLLVKEASAMDNGGANLSPSLPSKSSPPPRLPAPAMGSAQPALALTLVGDLKGEDGLLTMKEVIEDLDINARLVVLSACNTAGEKVVSGNGEGFAGLTRAFMFAGARGLLVSHWSVESLSTRDLVTEVFRRLQAGDSVGTSLQKARLKIKAAYVGVGADRFSQSHPYFWAPFVYVGDE